MLRARREYRVYVDPGTARVLKIDDEDRRVDKFMARLHGELLLGDWGSWAVELAASWAVVMVVTGLFLWWPRSAQGLGGVLYPRVRQGKRTFWRDLHAVTGIYISAFALFLLFTGLPWAKSWGGYLKAARRVTGSVAAKQDWTTSSAAEKTARAEASDAMAGMNMGSRDAGRSGDGAAAVSYGAIDQMVATVAPLAFDGSGAGVSSEAGGRRLDGEVGHAGPAAAGGSGARWAYRRASEQKGLQPETMAGSSDRDGDRGA